MVGYGGKVYLVPLFSVEKMPFLNALPIIFYLKVNKISRESGRRINKLEAVARDGTINQDFGRTTYVFNVEGELYSYFPEWFGFQNHDRVVTEVLTQYMIEYCFIKRIPLLFSSDIDTTIVIIESEEYEQNAERPYSLIYRLKLLEITELTAEQRLKRKAIFRGIRSAVDVGRGLLEMLGGGLEFLL